MCQEDHEGRITIHGIKVMVVVISSKPETERESEPHRSKSKQVEARQGSCHHTM